MRRLTTMKLTLPLALLALAVGPALAQDAAPPPGDAPPAAAEPAPTAEPAATPEAGPASETPAPTAGEENAPGNADKAPGNSEGAASENGAANANPNATDKAAPLNNDGAGDPPPAATDDEVDTSDIPPPSDSGGIYDSEVEEPQIPKSQWSGDAEASITGMRNKLTKTLGVLSGAREAKDAVKLTCVNDKVVIMKGVLRIAETSYVELQEAIANNNWDKGKYEFHKIKVSKKKMDELAEAAKQCVGAEATYTGETDVQVDVDGDVVGDGNYYDVPDFFNTGTNLVDGTGSIIGNNINEGIDTEPPVGTGVMGN